MRHRKSRATTPTSTLHQPLSRSMNVLSICAGYGGIDLGLRLAVPSARTVCWVEREAAACEILVRRMSEGWLDPAPIWTDATTFDGKPWNGVVDCIAAGIPCQPWSTAGKRKGFEDERHLGEHLVRTVGEVGPGLVFVENVAGFVRQGLPDLLGRLAELGYDAQWGVFSAAGVGASHQRSRLFLLAYSTGRDGRDLEQWLPRRRPRRVRDQGQAAAPYHASRLVPAFAPGPAADLSRYPCRLWPSRERRVRRLDDGAPGRLDQLRMLGNGVVPLAAAHAFRTLSSRIHP